MKYLKMTLVSNFHGICQFLMSLNLGVAIMDITYRHKANCTCTELPTLNLIPN